jgi:hypothetical protein
MSLERMPARIAGVWEFAPAVCLLAAAAAMLALPPALCAQHLPPTPPTSARSPISMAAPAAAAAPIAAEAPSANTEQHHRARVNCFGGMLEVRADNSSLNQILRDISRQTGMKIVGGVADQRVFGIYGPAPAGTVLQTLLDGTGANVLLKESSDHAPEELVLTPRTGGVTPPPPGSPTYDATEAEPELPLPGAAAPASAANPTVARPAPANATSPGSPSTPPSMPQPANNVLGNPDNVSPTASTLPTTNSIPVNSLPTPSTAPPVRGIVDAPNPPPAGSTTAGFTSQTPPDNNPNTNPNTAQPASTSPAATTTQTSPNGVKTPEQIYQELLQMQQKGNQKANPQGSSAPQ